MNFNVYMDPNLAKKLEAKIKESHKTRNAIIREALDQYLAGGSQKRWSEAFLNFTGDPNSILFESYRDKLSEDSDREFLF